MNAPRLDLVGRRVRFAPSHRWPDRKVEGVVVRHRWDVGSGAAEGRNQKVGWFDVKGDDGFERSVRPTMCELIP